ncbi:GntR family transcriptional regulator [Microvirga massiliensis]|uniref:GntR family transcriptional regulator n=1 Tax=Microvirga massiliensis TaxID=1033741 RepID=UPI00062B5CF1|nr:GntR family transcriptional regulator [Microvirga massiliensis]
MVARTKTEAAAEGAARAEFRNQSRSEYAFRALRDAIHEGRLKPGERLREEELAQTLGVSRTPIREALGRLQARGLVEVAPPRGLIVAALDSQRIIELYAVREILEGAAARFSAEHASPVEIAAMRRLAQDCAAAKSAAVAAERNARLHRMIYEAAHNRYLIPALTDFQDALALLPGTTFGQPGRREAAHAEHTAIIDAIARRDPDAAEAAARAHIRAAQDSRIGMLLDSD